MLILIRREGERIIIDEDIILKVLAVVASDETHERAWQAHFAVHAAERVDFDAGWNAALRWASVRLGFDAPDEVGIWREEIWERMKEEEA